MAKNTRQKVSHKDISAENDEVALKQREYYKCTSCSYWSYKSSMMKLHELKKHNKQEEKSECCGIQFSTKIEARNHTKNVHQKVYECQFDGCEKIFKSKNSFTEHYDTHKNVYDKSKNSKATSTITSSEPMIDEKSSFQNIRASESSRTDNSTSDESPVYNLPNKCGSYTFHEHASVILHDAVEEMSQVGKEKEIKPKIRKVLFSQSTIHDPNVSSTSGWSPAALSYKPNLYIPITGHSTDVLDLSLPNLRKR